MLGIINSNKFNEILELIAFLSLNDCDNIYLKNTSLSNDELNEIVKFSLDYGANLIFNGNLYSLKNIKKFDLNIKIVNSSIDKIIEIQRNNLDELLIFNKDLIIYYNLNILVENKLCLIIDKELK